MRLSAGFRTSRGFPCRTVEAAETVSGAVIRSPTSKVTLPLAAGSRTSTRRNCKVPELVRGRFSPCSTWSSRSTATRSASSGMARSASSAAVRWISSVVPIWLPARSSRPSRALACRRAVMSVREPTAPSTRPLSVTRYADQAKTRRSPSRVCSRCMPATGTPALITCPARVRSIRAVSTTRSAMRVSERRRPMSASSGRPASWRNAALVRRVRSSRSLKTMAAGAWSNSASSSRMESSGVSINTPLDRDVNYLFGKSLLPASL